MRLLTQNRTIQVLKLNNNGLGIGGGELISQALVEAQELNDKEGRPSSLRVIQMGRNRLESPGAKFLSAAFAAHCESLEEVRLYQNSIRPDVFPVLMKSLGKCTNLVSLDVQDNTLTELGSEALASAVASWPHLKSLNVGECLLRPTGSKTLFKALTEGHTLLEKLYLSFNEIDTAASALLPTLLTNKAQLTLLELNGNEFDPEGSVVQAVLDTLRSHGHPDALDELDEMEWGDDEEESDEEEEEDASTAAQIDEEDVDALTRAVAQVQV